MNIIRKLEAIRQEKGAVAFALVDPDLKNEGLLKNITSGIVQAGFDAILVGGSLIMDNGFEDRINEIRENSTLPIIIFPGSSRQLSGSADAVLFLSLHSGRNPQYLIGEQVQSAPVVNNLNLESIPTSYLLIDGGVKSSVQVMSNTIPLPSDKMDIILAHALAGQFMGSQLVFLEAGSGAINPVPIPLLEYLCPQLDIPVVVGGGIRDAVTAGKIVSGGAGYVVVGNFIEKCKDQNALNLIVRAIHSQEN